MLRIQRTTDRAALVLTVSGRLDAENICELCDSLDAIPDGAVVVLDLTDLLLADRDAVRLLRKLEATARVVLRHCPAYIRIWMAAADLS